MVILWQGTLDTPFRCSCRFESRKVAVWTVPRVLKQSRCCLRRYYVGPPFMALRVRTNPLDHPVVPSSLLFWWKSDGEVDTISVSVLIVKVTRTHTWQLQWGRGDQFVLYILCAGTLCSGVCRCISSHEHVYALDSFTSLRWPHCVCGSPFCSDNIVVWYPPPSLPNDGVFFI